MYWQMRFAGQHVRAFCRDSPHEVWAARILNIGGRVARIAEKRGNRHAFAAAFIAVAVVALVAAGFTVITLEPAVASHDVDNSTLGIGEARNTVSDDEAFASSEVDSNAQERISDSNSLTKTASRTITVKDPDPVIALAAYDVLNSSTAEAALALGTTNPLPTAPRILPDESDDWSYGMASAYSRSDNDDGSGNFCTDATASGRLLSENELTVAVPQSQSNLLGHAVAIRYGETIIVATVTDTGGFEKYGRALDLAPGCWKALGASQIGDWGVKPVYYKFL